MGNTPTNGGEGSKQGGKENEGKENGKSLIDALSNKSGGNGNTGGDGKKGGIGVSSEPVKKGQDKRDNL